jgi:hypothetical protein
LTPNLPRQHRTCRGYVSSGWPLSSRRGPAEVSRARGRGRMARGASRAIARGGSSTPTRSARTPPVASSRRRRLERPSRPAPTHVCAMGAPRRPVRAPRTSSPDELIRARFREHASSPPETLLARGSPGPSPCAPLARRHGARAKGRFPRSFAKTTGICCTRGAFHRWASRGFEVPGGPSPSARPARSPFPADRPRASAFFIPGIGPPP